MVVLGQAIAVVIIALEPPVVQAHERLINILKEIYIRLGLVNLRGRPGKDRRLGDFDAVDVVHFAGGVSMD